MLYKKSQYEINSNDKLNIIDGLEKLILQNQSKGSQKEQEIQNYFEVNTELFSVHNTYKNYFHQNMLLSKFPIGNYKTDYVYISKKSDCWRVVLGEFELPDNKFFKQGTTDFTQAFNHALEQIQDWQIYLKDNKNEFIKKLEMLYQPSSMRRHPTEFRFELIYGRSSDKNLTKERMHKITDTADRKNIDIMSYDTVINNLRDSPYVSRKNSVSYNGSTIKYKQLNVFPDWDFSLYNKEEIRLTKEQKELLIINDVEINEWENGKLLDNNGKVKKPFDPKESIDRLLSSMQNK